MKKTYLQLTFEDRRLIAHWQARNLSITAVALKLDVHKSTISRELKRNGKKVSRNDLEFYARLDPTQTEAEIQIKLARFGESQNVWTASDAQRVRQYRLHLANKLRRRKKSETAKWVIQKLKQHWSPEQIAGRSKMDAPESVSREYVYQLLYQNKKAGGTLYRLLKRFGKRKQRLNERIYPSWLTPKNKLSIEDRPDSANNRSELGHLEGDLIVGANQSGYILSVIDRKSRQLVLRKLKSKRKTTVRVQLERAIRKMRCAKSLTLDNGTEFFDHEELTRTTKIPVYFTHPYCSTDKGSIENANALIRYYYPKKTNFRKLTQSQLNKVEFKLNHRPRKILRYLTPCEAHLPHQLPKPSSRKCCTSNLHPPYQKSY